MRDPDMPLFCYCMDFGRREFSIYVDHEGKIYWDDVTQRRSQRSDGSRCLELRALVGDVNAKKRLESEVENYTIHFDLPEDVLSKIEVAAEMLEAGTWTTKHEEELDAVLEPLFWENVNPYLEPPLERKTES
jgi:hypothetical protein